MINSSKRNIKFCSLLYFLEFKNFLFLFYELTSKIINILNQLIIIELMNINTTEHKYE